MRSVINWIGSKYWIAKTIVNLMPTHEFYIEVFGGGGSVLFVKSRLPGTYVEIYNDVDDNLINFFSVVQKRPWDLITRILFTPSCSRSLFNGMSTSCLDDVERAFAFYYLNAYSFGGRGGGLGFPRKTARKCKSLINAVDHIVQAWERLEGVYIESLDYRDCIRRYDSEKAFFFLDPPYFKGTKPYKGVVDLAELSQILKEVKGKFILTIDEEGSHFFSWIKNSKRVSKKPGIENRKKVRLQQEVIFWNYDLKKRFIDACSDPEQAKLTI